MSQPGSSNGAHSKERIYSGQKLSTPIESALQELNRLFEALDTFAIISKTDKHGVITYANHKFCEISRYSLAELIGKPHSIIRSSAHSKEFFRDIWKTIQSGKPWSGEIQNRAKDGSPYWLYSLVFPSMMQNKVPTQYMSIRFDITPLKNANERQSVLLDKLNKVNQELEDFAFHVSHDLKAPLNGINNALGLLLDDQKLGLSEFHKKTLGLVTHRIKRLEHLISGLLDFSRAGVINQNIEEVNFSPFISEVVDLLEPSRTGIQFFYPRKKLGLKVEKIKLHQLFQNLISNAVKFMDKKKGKITIGYARRRGEIQFFVKDNGPGIRAQDRNKVFDLFVTGTSATPDHHNTGIGLAIVKKIVERYGGRIWIRSALRQGTTFTFTLPRCFPVEI